MLFHLSIFRRTEELINGVYSQYLYEQHIYNGNHPAPPNTTYLKDPSAPLSPTTRLANVNENTQTFAIQSRLANYLTHPESATDKPLNDIDSQVDSGHPSLDQSNSPTNEPIDNISASEVIEHGQHRKFSDENAKSNPFVVNGIKRPPNKVILQPLDHKVNSSVPKHLFVAKKLTQ